MNWDVHIWKTRDGKWRARIGAYRTNEYYTRSAMLRAVDGYFAIVEDV